MYITRSYVPKFGGAKMWRAPSKDLEQYQARVKDWAMEHFVEVRQARESIKHWEALEVHLTVCLPKDKLFTQNDDVKRLDITNRVKAAHDSVLGLLGIDDKLVFKATCEKIVGKERAILCIKEYKARSFALDAES